MKDGLVKAHLLLEDYHDKIMQEHRALPGSWFFGTPRKRHHEIMTESRLLKKLSKQIADEIAKSS